MNIFLLNVYYLILNSNIPYFLNCKTCKYVKNVSFNKYVCKKFINIDNTHYKVERGDLNVYDNILLSNIEIIRNNNSLCGENATMYERRIN